MFFQKLARPVGLVLAVVANAFLGACDTFEEVDFQVVANNVNSPDPVKVNVNGQDVGTVSLGNPVNFLVTIQVPNNNGTATGPNRTQQCFPISGSVVSKNLGTRSSSICAREGQIITADFSINRGLLELQARVR